MRFCEPVVKGGTSCVGALMDLFTGRHAIGAVLPAHEMENTTDLSAVLESTVCTENYAAVTWLSSPFVVTQIRAAVDERTSVTTTAEIHFADLQQLVIRDEHKSRG